MESLFSKLGTLIKTYGGIIMKLKLMFKDDSKKEIIVQRVFTINTPAEQLLYYECCTDEHGYGKKIPVSELKCWEVDAIIAGGSVGLLL